MADIVGGFCLPHDPMIFTAPDAVPAQQSRAVHDAFEELALRLRRLDADVAIVIGADHYVLFGPHCIPPYVIGIGHASGPLERLPGLPRQPFTVPRDLARHIVSEGSRSGFDWPVATAITVDHSIGVAQRLLVEAAGVPATIPVYVNCGVEPVLPMERARDLGLHLAEAVDLWPGRERVVVIGCGGLSHWVGTAEMGRVNEPFDRWVLDRVEVGDVEGLVGLSDERLLAEAGNGSLELRNFVVAMAATRCGSGSTVAYVPAPGWITGLGFVELHVGAEPVGAEC